MKSGSQNGNSPNIIILVLDTARASNFSCYGHERATTPTIDLLADKGVLFERATSVSPWTLPSHSSLFTGVPPSVHRTNSLDSKLSESIPTLAEVLNENGYNAVGMSANPWFSSQFGIIRGFDDFHHLFGPFATDSYRQFVQELTNDSKSPINRIESLLKMQTVTQLAKNTLTAGYRQFENRDDDGARTAVRQAKEVINGDSPYFLFINFLEPHLPFDPPSDCRRKFISSDVSESTLKSLNQNATAYNIRNVSMTPKEFDLLERLYDAELFHVDRQIEKIVSAVDATGQRENTLIAVLGDHGENIGEHDLMAHHYSVHETLLHVPLIIYYPDVFESEVVNRRISSLDVPATIADILSERGIDTGIFSENQHGHSLNSELTDNRTIVGEYLNPMPPIERLKSKSENSDFDISQYDRKLRAIYDGDYKLIQDSRGNHSLFDLESDYGEKNDISETMDELTNGLLIEIEEWVEGVTENRTARGGGPESEIEDRLSDLGYL